MFPCFLKFRRLVRNSNDKKTLAFSEFCTFLGFSPSIILFFIKKITTKSRKANNLNTNNMNINKSINDIESVKSLKKLSNEIDKSNFIKSITNHLIKNKIFLIIFISFLQVMASILKILFRENINQALKINIQTLCEILFLIFFSVIFLELSIFSHQIFSIIIITICLLIFFIESIVYHQINFKEVIYTIIYFLFLQFFYCLSDVLGKKYLNTHVDNFYFFLFKIGIIGSIPFLLFATITYFTGISEKYEIFQIFPKIKIFTFLLDLLFTFLYEVGLWLTIYYFTPCHYFIFETIADFLEIILSKLDNSGSQYVKEQLITFFILYPILLFAIFVFNEIIIINLCGLEYNTAINIMEREEKENNNDTDENDTRVSFELGENFDYRSSIEE